LLWDGRFFGYEEHYEISMQMGEDTLFQKIRSTAATTSIAAAGTSRHQILMEQTEKHNIR
jgi:hypothetical protein